MDNHPIVSIVLPTYNGARYIKEAIDSCLSQTFADFELIIIDDCSVDETPAIIRSYNDTRIRKVRNRKNLRLPRSLNKGFSFARGKYLTWTSDDNQYLPEALETMVRFMESDKNINFVYADYWQYHFIKGEKKIKRLADTLDLTRECRLGACFLYTRKVYETVGKYDPKYEMVEDYDYWIRVSRIFKLVHCPHVLYIYTYHSNSLTITRSETQMLFDRILKFENTFISRAAFIAYVRQFVEDNFYKKRRHVVSFFGKIIARLFRVSLKAGGIFTIELARFILIKIVCYCPFRKRVLQAHVKN
jgi:glycosyltransferase involved in cell wall biosynthesis